MKGSIGSNLHQAKMRLNDLSKLWGSQEWEYRDMDDLHSTYGNFELRLSIPNGGYIGVSIWDLDRRLGWFLPTELLPEHNAYWYSDKERHVALGENAIAKIRNLLKPKKKAAPRSHKPTPGQLSLLDLPEQLTQEGSEANWMDGILPKSFTPGKPRLFISFSGGRSSAVMTHLCLEKYKESHEIVVLFANTGSEHPATLEFVRDCDRFWGFDTVWLEAVQNPHGKGTTYKVVDFDSASRNNEPYETYIAKYGIPNKVNPQCTNKLKLRPMNAYLADLGWRTGAHPDFTTAIGIRADEIDRFNKQSNQLRIVYPLADLGITKTDVNEYMKNIPWDLKIPGDHYGNCIFCWKKSRRKLLTLAKQDPGVFSFPAEMEKKYGGFKTAGYKATSPDGRRYFYRGHTSAVSLLKAAKTEDFEPYLEQAPFDPDLDVGGSCSEGCEIHHDDLADLEVSAIPFFKLGDIVRCIVSNDEHHRIPWSGQVGVVEDLDGDRIFVRYQDFPPYPYRKDRLEWVEDAEVAQSAAEAHPGVPHFPSAQEPDGRTTLKEWRWWAPTQRWTYTGFMGVNITARWPESRLFQADVDPNIAMRSDERIIAVS